MPRAGWWTTKHSGDANHLNTYDLVAGNYQLNWPAMPMPLPWSSIVADGLFDITGYTTDATHYIRVYTPMSSSEVGVSQRHRGVFGTGFQVERLEHRHHPELATTTSASRA